MPNPNADRIPEWALQMQFAYDKGHREAIEPAIEVARAMTAHKPDLQADLIEALQKLRPS